MGELMRTHDWSKTPIGPVENWPQSLKTGVRIVLNSRFAMFVWWGRELTNLYNDPYRAFLGIKHPQALGKSAREVWAEIWDQIGPRADAVLLRGESTYDEALLLLMERHGYLEETYFTFSYSPFPDDAGKIAGLFCAVTEETQQVIGERRLKLLREIAAATGEARTPARVCQAAARSLAGARRDLPFSLIYLLDSDGKTLKRACHCGIASDHAAAPGVIDMSDPDLVWPVRKVIESGEPVLLEDIAARIGDLPKGEWNVPPRSAVLMPVAHQGQARPAGVFIAGLNPHRQFDEGFQGFVSLLSNQIAAAVANAVAYETERKRAESLAELDRAKTLFFSNVSHEFRTPLTLMLGPLEEVLPKARETLLPEHHEQLDVARRNALRLLKLVNTLLDFSRIEAGRVEAQYQATDIASLTAEIASVFRSTIEKAGLQFTVACEPVREPVYVDREMWDKIVVNLLSNAFKFTFQGEIKISLRQVDSRIELSVRDTGTGIPAGEIPRLFDRFYRVKNARGRSYEGSGIGLSLVQELVKLHSGTVQVESHVNRGSCFIVSLPLGKEHLPADRIHAERSVRPTALALQAWVDEAERWLPNYHGPSEGESIAGIPAAPRAALAQKEKELVLVADDNSDMRDYLRHLLQDEYRVHTVGDGLDAVQATRELRPALVLADVMMPGMDGFQLLQAIRSDSRLSSTPVILLSARAGEESRIEGLEAGADDYLVKPFTARELNARVATHIRMANVRREAAERQSRLRKEAELERHRLQELLQQAPAAIGLLNGPEHRWSYVNDNYVRVTGRKSAADFVGKTIVESLPDLETQVYRELLDQVYQTGQPYFGREAEVRLNRSDTGRPEQAYFDFVYQPVLNSEGQVGGVLVHAVEVTDRVLAHQRIQETQERLHSALIASQRLAAIVECSDDAIVSKDLNGIVSSWNKSAERLFGYKAEEIIGRPILLLIPPELHSDEDMILAKIRKGEKIDHFETVRQTKSGDRIDVSLSISPVRDEHGKIIGAAKIARDITQNKKIERALRITEKLAAAGRLAATVAHEINNPLEAVTNLVYLAKRDAANADKVRAYLDSARTELGRVAHIARQTLGFYRDTSSPVRFNVAATIDDLLGLYEKRLHTRNIHLVKQYDRDLEITALAGEIRQAVSNLITNAIDAMPTGGSLIIRVSKAHAWNNGAAGVRITVLDTGSGIEPEHRKNLFQPFFTTKIEVGTGLGLWITRNIVEKHNGRIRVKSRTGPREHGTAFSIFLPLQYTATVLAGGDGAGGRATSALTTGVAGL